jgi:1-acyl-sn-glycerol-3-phosphate acyltransferase
LTAPRIPARDRRLAASRNDIDAIPRQSALGSARRRLSIGLRVVGTGLSFVAFGLGGLLLAFVLLPLVRLTTRDTRLRQERAQWLVHLAFRFHVWVMRVFGVMQLSVRGAERLREPGGQLIVANHPTLIDVVLIGSLLPQLDCLVKTGAFHNPFMRGAVRAAGYVPNDLGEAVVEACAERLRAGRSLLMFPEGTRSMKDGKLGAFHRGAAHVALRSGRPIRPLVITCQPRFLTRGQHWYDVADRPMGFMIEVGEPMDPQTLTRDDDRRGVASRKLTAALRDFYQARLYPAAGQGAGDALQGRDLQVGHRPHEDGVSFP